MLTIKKMREKDAARLASLKNPNPTPAELETARRLYAFMDPWERCETTEEETAEEIQKNPIDAILYLLDAIEN